MLYGLLGAAFVGVCVDGYCVRLVSLVWCVCVCVYICGAARLHYFGLGLGGLTENS